METYSIKDPNYHPQLASNSPCNGFHHAPTPRVQIPSDIEMMTVQSVGYTSLKDLLPAAPSPPTAMSPTPTSSWHEIPIKNPLVKHAAMAYLQPMSSLPEIGNKGGLFGKLREKCSCDGNESGCLGWVYDIVLGMVKEVFGDYFWEGRRGIEDDDDDDDEDEDEEDEHDYKVD